MKTIILIPKNCFTLLELVFVALIICILAGILLPTLQRARESANRAKCASNLTQIDMLLEMYARDYDGYMPPGAGPDGDIPTNDIYNTEKGYVGLGLLLLDGGNERNLRLFICPTDTATGYFQYVDKGFKSVYFDDDSYTNNNPFNKKKKGDASSEYGGMGGDPFGDGMMNPFGDYGSLDEEYDSEGNDITKKIYKSSYIYRGYFGVSKRLRQNKGRALVMDYDFLYDSNKLNDTAEVLFTRERLTGSPELSDEEKAKLAAAEEEENQEVGNYPEDDYADFGGDPFGGGMGDYGPARKFNHDGYINVFIHGVGLRRHVTSGGNWRSIKSGNNLTVQSQTISGFTRVFQNADDLK